jgi:uncharacterized protein (DUF885 family)
MFNRRDFLAAVAVAVAVAVAARVPPAFGDASATAGSRASAALRDLFEKLAQQRLRRSPTLVTSLGLDSELADAKGKLGERSPAAVASEAAEAARALEELRRIDRTSLSGADAVGYDTLLFTLDVRTEADRHFDYGGGGAGEPYVLSQLNGSYRWIPDFLDKKHRIETIDDAEFYLARLEAFAALLDEELELAKHDVDAGVIPPDFVIEKAVAQLTTLLRTPAEKSTLVRSLARRAAEKSLGGDWESRAEAIYARRILPALERQANHIRELLPRAVHTASVARLPEGEEFYRLSLKDQTTSTLSPEEIHRTGLDLVAQLSSQIAALLDAQGLPGGSVGGRLAALRADPQFLYENTDAGRERLIADLNRKVVVVQGKLHGYFRALPKAPVEIRRVPKEIELATPSGYYEPGPLDGSRPGAYYINLRDTAEHARWRLPTLTFHESIPGHHLQITLANEASDLPLLRKIIWFASYGEGWALYSEQLAVEMGLYDEDPFGHVGQLQAALFRAVRLVVDTGLHAKGWSREQAIDYFVRALGDTPGVATTEVERYCVWPGQACSYMVGKLTWLRLRDEARRALGPDFDLRKFHDAGLLSGAMPLAVLERVIGDYARSGRI